MHDPSPISGTTACGAAVGSGVASTSGNSTDTLVPLPAEDWAQICPPDCRTMPWTVARPSPVPLPTSFVVKNGSKARARMASSIPAPLSATVSSTAGPVISRSNGAASSTRRTLISRMPPPGMASREFTARLTSTCSPDLARALDPLVTLQLADEDVGIAVHRCEHVVEVVSDATGEMAHGFEASGFDELGLEAEAIGHVDHQN